MTTPARRAWTIETQADLARFLKFVKFSDGCWEWIGARKSDIKAPYGLFRLNGTMKQAHRVSWQTFMGLIPDGLTLDHLCKNQPCIRPSHLEPVTLYENWSRGDNPASRNRFKTHCDKGHELAGDNLHIVPANGYRSYRRCRECSRQTARARYRKKVNHV